MISINIVHIVSNIGEIYGGPSRSVPYLSKFLNDICVNSKILYAQTLSNEKNEIVEKYSLEAFSKKVLINRGVYYIPNYQTFIAKHATTSNCILHVHSIWRYPAFCAYQIHKKLKLPLVCSIRSNLYSKSLKRSPIKKNIAWNLFVKNMLQSSSCVHATEENEVEAIREAGVTTPVALIPNGIDLFDYEQMPEREAAKKALGLCADRRYILFLSRLHPRKGLDLLIHSWIKLRQLFPDWDLHIVGPDEDIKYVKKLKATIIKSNIQSRVIFSGHLSGEQKKAAYASCELFVLPSAFENFGLVIAEALAAGRPVVTTTSTPWKDIDKVGCGWWIDQNESLLTDVIRQACSLSTNELDEMGARGKYLLSGFDWLTQAKKMKMVYSWINNNEKKPEFVFYR